ncbi:MAG: hypothetical protein ACAI34_06205 [Verrucomicrobium sp.]
MKVSAMTLLRSFALAGVALALAACSSTPVSLDYQPGLSQGPPGPRRVAAGRFADLRNENPYYLGTVKTPIGTPLENLMTNVPVAEVVRNAFAHGLSSRKMLVSHTSAPYLITGEILELRCDQVVRPGAYAKIRVNVVKADSGQVVFSRIYNGVREMGAYMPGSGSPVPTLRELMSRALQDVIDRALDDSALRTHLRGSAPSGYGPDVL